MGLSVITSAASHHRVARGRDWLKARPPTEEILIIGATLGAANGRRLAHTRMHAREKSLKNFRLVPLRRRYVQRCRRARRYHTDRADV